MCMCECILYILHWYKEYKPILFLYLLLVTCDLLVLFSHGDLYKLQRCCLTLVEIVGPICIFMAFTIGNSRLNHESSSLCWKKKCESWAPFLTKLCNQCQNLEQQAPKEAAFDIERFSSDASVQPNNHSGFSCNSRKFVFTGSHHFFSSHFISHPHWDLGSIGTFSRKQLLTRGGLCEYNSYVSGRVHYEAC